MMRIEQHHQRFIQDPVAALVNFFNGVPGEPKTYAPYFRIVPVLFCHFLSIGPEPRKILDFGATDFAPLEKSATPENWMNVK